MLASLNHRGLHLILEIPFARRSANCYSHDRLLSTTLRLPLIGRTALPGPEDSRRSLRELIAQPDWRDPDEDISILVKGLAAGEDP